MATTVLRVCMGAHSRQAAVERISTRVIESIADARDVDPTDLDVPLYWEIDLEALDRLCESDTAALEVTFTYDGTTVTVRGDGRIEVGSAVYEA
jgi:hypothetical protein